MKITLGMKINGINEIMIGSNGLGSIETGYQAHIGPPMSSKTEPSLNRKLDFR